MAPVSILAVKAFFSKWGLHVAIGVLLVTMLTVSYCKGQQAGKSGEVVKQQAEEIKVQASVGAANDTAADRRVTDSVRLTREEQELRDATRNATSDADRRRRRGCVIMRQQGQDTSRIPACSGS